MLSLIKICEDNPDLQLYPITDVSVKFAPTEHGPVVASFALEGRAEERHKPLGGTAYQGVLIWDRPGGLGDWTQTFVGIRERDCDLPIYRAYAQARGAQDWVDLREQVQPDGSVRGMLDVDRSARGSDLYVVEGGRIVHQVPDDGRKDWFHPPETGGHL